MIFDPSKEELAVAEAVMAISVGEVKSSKSPSLRVLAIRSIDPPSRLTPPGVPNALNSATGGVAPTSAAEAIALRESMQTPGVWTPPRGGIKRGLISRAIKEATRAGGVAEEVMEALEKVEK